MKKNKHKCFKKEIKKTFILYTSIPIFIFSVLIFSAFFLYISHMIKKENIENNIQVSSYLQSEFDKYKNELNKISISKKIISILEKKTSDKTLVYKNLYRFVNSRKLKSLFYVFDNKGNTIITNVWKNAGYHVNDYTFQIMIKKMKSFPQKMMMIHQNNPLVTNSKKIYSIGKAIVDRNNVVIGYVLFDFTTNDLNNIIYNKKVDILVITDQFGNVIATTNNLILNNTTSFTT